ncbi:MAG: hypothetical protein FWG40_12930 [Peptococcaceae bacterium]|nr:hypothetical protein [Peptococcaceae bacterium]
MTDTLLKSRAMDVLVKSLGVVETERFITLILKEPFDYTEWRRTNLPDNIPVEVLNRQATEYWNRLYPEPN